MKKTFLILVLAVALIVSSCSFSAEDNGKIDIIATNFPAYDFARAVAGDTANVKMLLPTGAQSHSYEPSAKDIIAISECELFVYNGGESDSWIDGILASLESPINTLKMVDAVDLIEADHAHDEKEKYDEHVWTSPENAITICNAIRDKLALIDPDNSDEYKENCALYTDEIKLLDSDFEHFFEGFDNKLLVFGDRFPFAYFANHYGVDHISAFPGCSSEAEPSMAQIAYMIDTVKNEKISTVFYIEFSNHSIADTIAEAAGASTKLFHSCHNVSTKEFDDGIRYVDLMRANLDTLKGTIK